jgi:3-methyladenine DNA glycosylase Tag
MEAPQQIEPTELGDYLEVMSKSVFQSGMSWKVVENKWPSTRDAFHDFEITTVASLTEKDISDLAQDTRVIRNRRKLEAIVGNARRIIELEEEYGGFQKYLRSHGDFETLVKDLRKQFKFLGDTGSYIFLYVVGEQVPPHEEWMAAHGG